MKDHCRSGNLQQPIQRVEVMKKPRIVCDKDGQYLYHSPSAAVQIRAGYGNECKLMLHDVEKFTPGAIDDEIIRPICQNTTRDQQWRYCEVGEERNKIG